jgi:AcrR family transcriptional regulator
MVVPVRILRAQADALGARLPALCPREQAQQERILTAAARMMAQHGRKGVTLRSLADALGMSPMTIRRLFCDLDSILAEILTRHLRDIAARFGELPQDTEHLHAARRAAYLAYTRTLMGSPTEHHLLLLRDRHALPPDLAEPLETLRQSIADMLAYPNGAAALCLLDSPGLHAAEIETMIAVLTPEKAEPTPQAGVAAANPARTPQAEGTRDSPGEPTFNESPARHGRFLN